MFRRRLEQFVNGPNYPLGMLLALPLTTYGSVYCVNPGEYPLAFFYAWIAAVIFWPVSAPLSVGIKVADDFSKKSARKSRD